MKKLLLLTIDLCAAIVFLNLIHEDKKKFILANNEVEDTLNTANNILCIISKIKAEEFIDKGPYKAQVFMRIDVM